MKRSPFGATAFAATTALVLAAAFAAQPAAAQDVLIVYADQHVNDVITKISNTSVITGNIATFDAEFATPVLADLTPYAAVLVFNGDEFANGTELGNVLADYVDAGGGVVLCIGTNIDSLEVGGRFEIDDYHPLNYQPLNIPNPLAYVELDTASATSHAVMNNVNNFILTGNSGIVFYIPTTARSGVTTTIADYNTGSPAIVERTGLTGKVIALNTPAPSEDVMLGGWRSNTQGGLLLANSLAYVAGTPTGPPPGVLTIVSNTGIALDQGESHTITTAELEANDSGTTPTSGITFTLTTAPANGALQVAGSAITVGGDFTQEQIDQGDVVYVHDDSLTASDSFDFDVTNGTTTLSDTVEIAIDLGYFLELSLPGPQSAESMETSHTLSAAQGNAISISYDNPAPGNLTLSLSVDTGQIEVASTTGLSLIGNNPGQGMLLTGTLADLNAALETGVTVTVSSGFSSTVELSVEISEPGVASDDGVVPIDFDTGIVGQGRSGCTTHPHATDQATWWWLVALTLLALTRRRI